MGRLKKEPTTIIAIRVKKKNKELIEPKVKQIKKKFDK